MKVKKLLAIVLSMVAVVSCTMLSASAETESVDFTSGKMYASITSTKARAYTSYVPGSYRIKRYVNATLYYRDDSDAMRHITKSQTVMENGDTASVEFAGSNYVSMTSLHTLGEVSKSFSVNA